MSLHRRAAKRDANEPAIVSTLEALGCVVWRVSGKGLPDLAVFCPNARTPDGFGQRKHVFVADVKGPKEKATPAQEEKWGAISSLGFSVFILRTPEDAAAMLNNALQPWEPTAKQRAKTGHQLDEMARKLGATPRRGSCTCGSRGRPVKRHHGTGCPTHPNPSRKGDAAKARDVGRRLLLAAHRCGNCLGVNPESCISFPSYTPPHSTPVDAAKEAEATFAPDFDTRECGCIGRKHTHECMTTVRYA